jgi:hypothetical protein
VLTLAMRTLSVGRLGEKYYLIIVIDGIDFVWPQTCLRPTPGSDSSRRPFARIPYNVSLENLHHPF